MNRFPIFLIPALLLFLADTALSNGGPMDGSHILSTGNITFNEIETIRLLDESISFTVEGDFVDVEAVYTLLNEGGTTEVAYAFPVDHADIYFGGDLEEWIDDEIPYFRILTGPDLLDVETVTAPDSFRCCVVDDYSLWARRTWFTAQIPFSAGDTSVVTVQYRFKTQFEDFVTNKDVFPSITNRYFRYVLNPAGYWSDGIVEDFGYTIDFSSVLASGGEVISVPECGTWISEDVFSFESNDFDILHADSIEVLYDIVSLKMYQYFSSSALSSQHLEEVNVSSTLQGAPDYAVGNLFDMDMTTAWVEGASGDGTGEWINIEFDDVSVYSIGIVNGYIKNETTYRENARIRKVELEIVIDEDGPYYNKWSEDRIEVIELPDLSWEEIENGHFGSYFEELYFDGGGGEGMESIRIKVLEVYPGTVYDDLCVTELIIMGYPY